MPQNLIIFPMLVIHLLFENFQMRNTNKTIIESFDILTNINKITKSVDKELVTYLSMCFGNPYGEVNLNLIDKCFETCFAGIKIISLSDTTVLLHPNQFIRYTHIFL